MPKLKAMLDIPPEDTSKDERLSFVLETVVQAVKTYCRLSLLPPELDLVIVQIAEDYYRTKYADEFPKETVIQSVKRGDVQTTFGAAKPTVRAGSDAQFVQGYASQLRAFRRMRW